MRSWTLSKIDVVSTVKSSYKSPKNFLLSPVKNTRDKRLSPMKDFYTLQRIMKEGVRVLIEDKKKKNFEKYKAPLPKSLPKKKVSKVKNK